MTDWTKERNILADIEARSSDDTWCANEYFKRGWTARDVEIKARLAEAETGIERRDRELSAQRQRIADLESKLARFKAPIHDRILELHADLGASRDRCEALKREV